MQHATNQSPAMTTPLNADAPYQLDAAIKASWEKIAPFWPLKNLIAVNPIAGFEYLPFETALTQARCFFQQDNLPQAMESVNRETIKWLQAFFDEGQSTIHMPNRQAGLLKSVLSLIRFDSRICKSNSHEARWLTGLPDAPDAIIAEALLYLGIQAQHQELFLTLMLTTLPGWAAHVQYRTNWADAADASHPHRVTQQEYLALRLVITCLIWPDAAELLAWHEEAASNADTSALYASLCDNEQRYQSALLDILDKAGAAPQNDTAAIDAQLVFCIDVRSEPFRRALEAQGQYQTYGFAGFFGVPVAVEDSVTGDRHASCPALLKPAHYVTEHPDGQHQSLQAGYRRLRAVKKLYQSLKYNFATPFSLVETTGVLSGLWMGMKTLLPNSAFALQSTLKQAVLPQYSLTPDVDAIPLEQQITYATSALQMIGLTKNFAPLVVLCGHGSTTQNNAYATALDCGACGGRQGAPNARIMAGILNSDDVRKALAAQNIVIPDSTLFLAAKHDTTTDDVELYDPPEALQSHASNIFTLRNSLSVARDVNSLRRCQALGVKVTADDAGNKTALRARDWAQLRPEWGLAGNAAFVIAPRWLTKKADLDGRSFLHSYEWEQDTDGTSLARILTAPMVVTQWINAQYFFSALDNVAYGGGSKITKNITGKTGIMQGNASDLMHGLPLQSVYSSDDTPYHQLVRLSVIVYAPKTLIDPIIHEYDVLQKLLGNGWLHLICHDPGDDMHYRLMRDFTWKACT